MVRDSAVADNVAGQVLVERKDGPLFASHTVGLCGTDVELGDNQLVTDFEGPRGSGWVDRKTRVERIELVLNPEDLAASVRLTQRDLDEIERDYALVQDVLLEWSE